MDISDFLKAFADDFKNLKFRAKIIVIVIGLVIWLVTSALFYPDAAHDRIECCTNWIRAAITDNSLPLSPSTRNKFIELQRSIETSLVNQVDSHLSKSISKEEALEDSKYNAWTTSQIAIALPIEANKHADTFQERFDFWKFNSGNGKNEFPNDIAIKIPILAWNISAQALIFAKIKEQDISFLLAQQNLDGWWGTYAGTDDPKYAATYATAIAVLALSDVVTQKRITSTQLPKILVALRTASDSLRVKKKRAFLG